MAVKNADAMRQMENHYKSRLKAQQDEISNLKEQIRGINIRIRAIEIAEGDLIKAQGILDWIKTDIK